MASESVYILPGYQTDFAKSYSKGGLTIFDLLQDTVEGALGAAKLDPAEVDVAHIGNFAGELFTRQGHLGGLFASIHPDLGGVPASRHEAACASGSAAVLAAAADIEAGRYDLACVVGLELMRNVPGDQAAAHLGAAAFIGREALEARYPWPFLFSRIADVYADRYGLRYEHLARIAQKNFENARKNPNAQARGYTFHERSFAEDDEQNPVVEGRIRKQDCSRITDGGAAIFLASARRAAEYAARRGLGLADLARLVGFGHRTAPMLLDEKLGSSAGQPYVFPQLRRAIEDAYRRAGIAGPSDLDGIEAHDCFTITEYMAIDHFGITQPGASFEAIERGDTERGGRIPVNPSGGLIGAGHPVGASGVRMLLDASKQVTGRAGDYQVEGARRFATLNIGGSATTCVSFIVSAPDA
jgi:acetyl-CoA C-acetyltransferase